MADKGKKRIAGKQLPAGAKGGQLAPAAKVPSALANVEVKVTIEFGRTEITVAEAIELAEKSVLAMDKLQNEPFDVCINGKLFGRGKLVMVGENYGVQLTEVIDQG